MQDFPTYYDIKLAQTSKIFESSEVIGLTPEQIQEGEKAYYQILDKLQKGEDIDEGLLTGIIGGAAGFLLGPAVGKVLCKVLGINEDGVLGKMLTSKLVTTAIGVSLGK
jgi:hypothetical protein